MFNKNLGEKFCKEGFDIGVLAALAMLRKSLDKVVGFNGEALTKEIDAYIAEVEKHPTATEEFKHAATAPAFYLRGTEEVPFGPF